MSSRRIYLCGLISCAMPRRRLMLFVRLRLPLKNSLPLHGWRCEYRHDESNFAFLRRSLRKNAKPHLLGNQFCPFNFWIVYQARNGQRRHFIRRVGSEQRQEGMLILEAGIKPHLTGTGREDSRHTVVDRSYYSVWLRGDNGATVYLLAIRTMPEIPEAGKGERAAAFQGDIHGSFAPLLFPPLIEAIGNHETAFRA